jgi:hypothetical protein
VAEEIGSKLNQVVELLRQVKMNASHSMGLDPELEELHSLPMKGFNDLIRFEEDLSSRPTYRAYIVCIMLLFNVPIIDKYLDSRILLQYLFLRSSSWVAGVQIC